MKDHARRIALFAAIFTGALAGPAQAATFHVNVKTDTTVAGGCTTATACSLRDAVTAANGAGGTDIISIPAGRYTLVSGELASTDGVTFQGAGARSTVIDAHGTGRVISESGSDLMTVSDLTLTGGVAAMSDGGGISSEAPLDLTRVAIKGNTASLRGGGVSTPQFLTDGGVATTPVTVTDSTISGNTVTGVGNGIGGGLATSGDLAVTNSTVSGNRVDSTGNNEASGIETAAGTTTLVNSTIAGNVTAGTLNVASAGITDTPLTPSQLVARNTIVAGNKAGTTTVNCALTDATPTTVNDISDDTSCGFTDSGSRQSTDPRLRALANNGGPTDTRSFAVGAPPFNTGSATGCPAKDQRGVGRPRGVRCDVGAVELGPPSAVTGAATDVATTGTTGLVHIAVAPTSAATLTGTVSNPLPFSGTVRFDYGTTAAYGQSAGAGVLPALSSGLHRSVRVTGLRPSTTYHYRLVATTVDGTAAGSDVVFRTPAAGKSQSPAIHRPRVSIRGVRGTGGSCVRGSFSIRVRAGVSSRTKLRSVRVRIDNRLVKRTRLASFKVRVRAKGLRRGRHKISVRATDRGGRTRVASRSFRRCAPAAVRVPRFTG